MDATQDPWKSNYQMFTYITEELPDLIAANFPVKKNKQSIMGHRSVDQICFYCTDMNKRMKNVYELFFANYLKDIVLKMRCSQILVIKIQNILPFLILSFCFLYCQDAL